MNEIERRALGEERRAPRYARGKEVRRRGYARYRFLKGFRVSLRSVRAGVGHGELTGAVQGRG